MPNDNTIPDRFREFMEMYQQASRPNPLEAIGSGMAGFAAPFLGQQWTNPNARKQQTIDPMMMYMMKDMFTKQQNQSGEQGLLDLLGKGQGTAPSELGITEASYDPATGDVKYNIGETPEMADLRKEGIAAKKVIQKEVSGANYAKGVLESLRQDWLATKPPKAGLRALQPFYGMEQRVGAPLQITRNQRADYKYVRRVKSLQSRIAKGVIGQDVGNLSYWEQEAAKQGVAGLTDTYETGMSMFNAAEALIDKMKEARTEGYASLDEKLKEEGRGLTKELAQEFLRKANGDKSKARAMAVQEGWAF